MRNPKLQRYKVSHDIQPVIQSKFDSTSDLTMFVEMVGTTIYEHHLRVLRVRPVVLSVRLGQVDPGTIVLRREKTI